MQEALVYRDDGVTELDYDVTGMLQHLRIGDDGSMAFADAAGAPRSSTTTVTKQPCSGRSSV